MKVVKATSRATQRGPAEWFTGIVWLDEIGVPEPPSRLRVHSVTFEPGARTAWHAHPLGQILHITHGKGRVGRGSGEVHEVQAGDTIYIDPGEVGRGIGRALLARVIERSSELGYRQMIAVIGGSETLPSIRLHAALGFAHIGLFPGVGFKFGR